MLKGTTVALFYKNQRVKMMNHQSEPWWALRDMVRIFNFPNISKLSEKLDKETCKLFLADQSDILGKHAKTQKMYFVNKIGLEKILTLADDKEKAEEFRIWIETEVLPNLEKLLDIAENTPTTKNNLSVAANLQKAQMLIRIAENKATPHNEQIRLLDMAVRELTGTGFNLDITVNAKPIDIMELPEVVVFIHKKETKLVDGVKVNYITADMIAKKWRTFFDNTFDGKAFSEIANEFGYKNPKFGYWQRVMTPDGEAREFMYFDGTVLDYINKKFGRVA